MKAFAWRSVIVCLALTLDLVLPLPFQGAVAQRLPSAQSGQLLGALKRDPSGRIRVVPGAPRQPSLTSGMVVGKRTIRLLPAIAHDGFIHRARAARYRRHIRDALNRARRSRRPGALLNHAGMTREQAHLIQWLRARDDEVRAHEAALYPNPGV